MGVCGRQRSTSNVCPGFCLPSIFETGSLTEHEDGLWDQSAGHTNTTYCPIRGIMIVKSTFYQLNISQLLFRYLKRSTCII